MKTIITLATVLLLIGCGSTDKTNVVYNNYLYQDYNINEISFICDTQLSDGESYNISSRARVIKDSNTCMLRFDKEVEND